jgi:hypothetical protein
MPGGDLGSDEKALNKRVIKSVLIMYLKQPYMNSIQAMNT